MFLVYLLLRRTKAGGYGLARGTGKVWFEVKILAALLLVFFCLPRPEYLGDIWQELTYAYSDTPVAEAVPGDLYINGDIMAELEQNGSAMRVADGEWFFMTATMFPSWSRPPASAQR